MLLEEAEQLLVRKSKEADEAKEAKALKDWEELRREEEATGDSAWVSTYRLR
jgi:hypothetical protein